MKAASIFSRLRVLLGLLLCLTGCGKEDVAPSDVKTRIIGRWLLQQTSGGLAGGTRAADPNQRRELVFTMDGKAQFLLNGNTEVPTGYAIRQAYVALTGKEETIVDFGAPLSSYAMNMIVLALSPTKLSLQEAFTDGQRYDYTRP